MNLEGTRRVMETSSHETANQYLRFGWSLINQYLVEATDHEPAMMKYVLASVRRLEDTRHVIELFDPQLVDQHLQLGWKLIEKFVDSPDEAERRHETVHFILAWQSEDPPPELDGRLPLECAVNGEPEAKELEPNEIDKLL